MVERQEKDLKRQKGFAKEEKQKEIISNGLTCSQKIASLIDQSVKNLPTMQETWVLSLSQQDPLEKEMATHSSILAWKSPWTEEPGGLQSMGSQRVGYD